MISEEALIDRIDRATPRAPLVDTFGRAVTYLRVSVTDRCDFRCVYCMAEHMTFLPKPELLTLEELDRLCSAFVARGVRKLRLTGGEPLVRRDVMTLFRSLGRHLDSGALEELTLTTNGSQLARFAVRARRLRRQAHQRLARHARPAAFSGADPLGRPQQGARRHRRGAGRRHPRQAQRRRPARRERGRDPLADRMGAWARHGRLADRGHAARRDRLRARRPVPAALHRPRPASKSAGRWRTSRSAPAARRATSRSPRPAASSASSPR